jgi:hypothetical protein
MTRLIHLKHALSVILAFTASLVSCKAAQSKIDARLEEDARGAGAGAKSSNRGSPNGAAPDPHRSGAAALSC